LAGRNKLGALLGSALSRLRGSEAAALIEFAVALPLLVVLVVGIFDFGAAFNLKQELSNAVREGAVFGASQPTNDLLNAGNVPPSVDAVRYLVASYLQAARINDCGLAAMPPPGSGGGQIWVYTTPPGSCPGLLQLTIKRPCIGPLCPPAVGTYTPNTYIPNTYVKISYPYQISTFNNVIKLLVPSASYALSSITADATAANLN
jgi:TadE-like protein